MTLLWLGLILWWAAHLYKRLAPGSRAALTERMGDASKGIVAAVLVVAIVLMVIGYRAADFVPVYDPPAWGRHLNNLLMYVAIVLLGLGNSKSRLRGTLRHPMLIGFTVWAVAHLLANGDVASLVLFGGLGAWAIVAILVINRAEPAPPAYEGGSAAGDVRLALIAAVIYVVIAAVHTWLGVWPFG